MGNGGVRGDEREQMCTPCIFQVVRLPDGAEEHGGDAWGGVAGSHVPKVSFTALAEKEKTMKITVIKFQEG